MRVRLDHVLHWPPFISDLLTNHEQTKCLSALVVSLLKLYVTRLR